MTSSNNSLMGQSGLLDNVEFINAINIVSFLIGLQNLELNVTAADLEKYSKMILEEIHGHLTEQDKHLSAQDKHLKEQDLRLDKLERMFYGRGYNE